MSEEEEEEDEEEVSSVVSFVVFRIASMLTPLGYRLSSKLLLFLRVSILTDPVDGSLGEEPVRIGF